MIKYNNISFSYGSITIFDNISIDVSEAGSIIGLMGQSGSGKSTLLNLITGFIQPFNGEIFISETNVTKLKPQDRGVAYVFQDYALFPNLTVSENIAFGLKAKKLSKSEIKEKVFEVVKLLEIDSLLNSNVEKISGGEKQRVALARSIVVAPKVLLLDEVFSAIDNNLKPELRKKVRELLKRLGITTILVSHSFEDITSVCDRVSFIENKLITPPATIAEVISNPPNYNIASLIGLENIFQSIDQKDIFYIPNEALNTTFKKSHLALSKLSEKYIGSVKYEVFKYKNYDVLFPHSGCDTLYLDVTKIRVFNE